MPDKRLDDLKAKAGSTAHKLGDLAGSLASNVRAKATEAAQQGAEQAGIVAGQLQRRLGEDYYMILKENPLVTDTLSRASLLQENELVLRTAFNIPWAATLFWSAAAGTAVSLQGDITKVADNLMHVGPGHIALWEDVNRFMDGFNQDGSRIVDSAGQAIAGSGHRLKWGHSLEALPQIVEKFGVKGVPAYFAHLFQDFFSSEGIPIVPNAWEVKQWLQPGIGAKVATGLVSVSFSAMLGSFSVLMAANELWRFAESLRRKMKVSNYLKTASLAFQNRDYNGAIANYQRVLEIERSPAVLMSLGNVYMQRAANRLRAHQAYVEAVTRLADHPAATVPYGRAHVSIRGLAGVQALATAEVLEGIHPEHWNDHVQDLVNATVFSFASTAAKQAQQGNDLVPDQVATPAFFSAAINYYLAARSACYYPLLENRQDMVLRYAREALGNVGRMAQYDENNLRSPATHLRGLWVRELLPPDEIEAAVATY